MLTPTIAALILIAVTLLLLILIPILDGSEKFHQYISLRYTLVAISLIMALGCVLDFSHLNESSRNIVLTGGLVLVGLFVVVRSLEKLKLGNKIINVSAEKGDIKVTANLQNKTVEKENTNEDPKTNGKHKVYE
jgi:uncharacterized protein YebE (UPF0316 family)